MLRLGQIASSSKDHFQKYPYVKACKKQIAVIHAYADQAYDRSSFHLAGNADLVADVASFVALDAIQSLRSFQNNHGSNDYDNGSSSKHPLIGLVDHISVMPLQNQVNAAQIDDCDTNKTVESYSSTEKNSSESYKEEFIPPDSHGLCCTFIGNQLIQNGIDVFYYGSAHPNHTPLSIVRREKTRFFNSGGLNNNSDEDNKCNQCTVGSPLHFVENFNILLSRNVDKKKAMNLTKMVRERDGGISGVEALTLPYSDGRFEVACNLLSPEKGSVDDIMKVLDAWIRKEQDDFQQEYGGTRTCSKEFLVESSYRVGTTSEQCLDILNNCKDDDEGFFNNYDETLSNRFCDYLNR